MELGYFYKAVAGCFFSLQAEAKSPVPGKAFLTEWNTLEGDFDCQECKFRAILVLSLFP